MPDKGHKMTDDLIKELEDKLHELYTKADSDLQEKAASRLKTYNEMVKVKEKTLDKDAFKEWKKNQAYILSNQKSLVDTIADDLVKTDQIALDIINDHTPKAYALNYNYGTYQIEDAGKINTSFALYNHETVELLALYDDSSLLPEKKDLDIPKDLQWNKKHLSQAIAQGVLQGESIDKIAKRLSAAVGMDENGAIRNARTMMTAAQNGGRVDAYLRGKSMGIELQQKWRATEDSRTRKSHRAIDGEVVEVGEIFSNKCHFPGDPTGPGREVYNCRCTLIPLVNGIKNFDPLSNEVNAQPLIGGQGDPEITDNIRDYFLPQKTREKLNWIEQLNTYDEFENYLNSKNIKLDVGIDKLKNEMKFDNMPPAVKQQCQKIATALEAYEDEFGPECLSKLKKIYLYDEDLDTKASYFFNQIGEQDPLAGEIHFRDWNASGHDIFHELAHAFQDSHAVDGEDALLYSNRIIKEANMPKSWGAYTGAISDEAMNAERFAEAFAYAFTKDSPAKQNFLYDVVKLENKNKKYLKKGFEDWLKDQADPYITAKFGDKSLNKVYHQLLDEKGSKIGNYFYNHVLGDIGKPSQTWKDYINGTLDSANTKKIDDYLFKHFDLNANKLDDAVKTVDKVDDISDVIKNAEADVKWIKGEPMSTADADNHKVNLLYNIDDKASKTNCQTCSFVYECRKQGYDVVALPTYDSDSFKDTYHLQVEISKDASVGWINKTTGKAPKSLYKGSPDYDAIDKLVGNSGERYIFSVKFDGANYHSINLDRDSKGNLRIIDNQRGPKEKNVWTGQKEIEEYFKNLDKVNGIEELIRVDDCVPNAKYLNAIAQDAKKIKNVDPYKNLNHFSEQLPIAEIAKKKGFNPEDYYNKWKLGFVEDKDLDAIMNIKSKTVDVTPKVSKIDLDALKDKKVKHIYDELKSEKTHNKFYNELKGIGDKDGIKQAEVWKKYLAGELNDEDTAKIEKYLVKKYAKGDIKDTTNDALEAAKKKYNVDKLDDAVEKIVNDPDAFEELYQYASANLNFDAPAELAKKYLKGEVDIPELDKHLATKVDNISNTKTSDNEVFDFLKKKYGYTNGDSLTDELWQHDDIWKIADKYAQEEKVSVWQYLNQYVNGKVENDELNKHLGMTKATTKISDKDNKTFDADLVKSKAVSSFINEWKKEGNTSLASQWWKTIGDIGKNYDLEKKQSKVWELYKTGKLTDDENKKIEDFLTKHYFNKSDDTVKDITKPDPKLKAAEEKLEKAKKELKNNVDMTQTWASIWKDDVTLADYEVKKSTIKAKKIYYNDELDKLHFDPSYKSWMSEEDKESLIWKYEKLLDDVEEYEQKGEEYLKYKKAIDKAQNKVNELTPSQFSKNYSQERKDAALYIRGSSSEIREEANKHFAAQSKKEFKAAKKIESDAIKEYTASYHKFNEPLRGIEYGTSKVKGVGNVDLNAGYADNGKRLNAMTDYLEKTNWSEDIWLQRGCRWGGMDNFLQVDMSLLQNGTEEQLRQALLGKTVTEYGFMSAGTGRGAGFSGNIIFNIFLPKGAKASYAEVYSHYKNGSEIETIIQQGAQFTVTRIDKSGGTWFIDLELSGYLPPQKYTP